MHPTLELYRQIRRCHRMLSPEMSYIGNNYVRDEFRRHRNADPTFVRLFVAQWQAYLEQLRAQLIPQLQQSTAAALDAAAVAADASATSASPATAGRSAAPRRPQVGVKLSEEMMNALNAQQLGQLYALRRSIRGEKD
ncbi:hypothetical protein CXG81DRAFT_28428 [Caulochytrium protostelioides]|uniref:Succinate dehydrogenase assembly factor 3 n=1 Tax=Caulochytrium protostelioides TaxID=1555241 RepID=A0A4P9X1H8_9FUNG|nr:hypothetical protein CXG81DRAFT_28428 [Caulochytrium protostelioides]|eukprot:RKO98773.1 hypothetical protein CXG81DRAFT_28428 [Caulochytrium protostelioides]